MQDIQYVGWHNGAMLGKGIGEIAPPPRPGFEVAICDLKALASSVGSWNMKYSENALLDLRQSLH